jgi:REP element-mobilizing transposase RayT
MNLKKLYFFTATILRWKPLLQNDNYKNIIIESLRNLIERKKIKVYGYVIMPNHIHLIWELLEMNGKEMPHASFMKFTSHQIQKDLKENHPTILNEFVVNRTSREYQYWQRDSLPILLYTPTVIMQKLNYIHNNPLQKKWQLASTAEEYPYSSAAYYTRGVDQFSILSNIGEWL